MRVHLRRPLNFLAFVASLCFLSGCAGASLTAIPPSAPSTINPQGPFAASIANLWWFILIVGALVFVGYGGLLIYASLRRRHAPPPAEPGRASPSLWVPIGGILIPAVILVVTYAATLNTMNAIP